VALSIGDPHLDFDQADFDPIVLSAQRGGERDDEEQRGVVTHGTPSPGGITGIIVDYAAE
jgi:hypothetical protein